MKKSPVQQLVTCYKDMCNTIEHINSHITCLVYKCFSKPINKKIKTKDTLYMISMVISLFILVIECKNKRTGFYEKCAISSELPEASEIGLRILQRGGNAMDAAIATCLAIGVVNSFSSGIGGGGFLLMKRRGLFEKATMIDFREKAPIHFDINKVLENRDRSKTGGMAVGIPCEINGLFYAHTKYGKLPWEALFVDVLELCKGFRVTKELARRLKKFEPDIFRDQGLKDTYTRNNELLQEGDIVVRDNLRRSLHIISKDPHSFYKGEIVDSLISFINKNGGSVTHQDFLLSNPTLRVPLEDSYKGYKLYTTNLPSSGILVLQALKILENLDIQKIYKDSTKKGAYAHIHVLVEILKFVMARRGELGDPNFLANATEIITKLKNPKVIKEIVQKINLTAILNAKDYNASKYNVVDHGTTHINVFDEDGLIVCLTSTINLEFGAKIMDPVTGVILNNQIDDFYFPESIAQSKQLHAIPNLARPSQIPLSSVSPIILEKENEIIALGAAGGIRIPTAIIEVIFWMTLGLDLEKAINKPRLHHQNYPDKVYVEGTESTDVIGYLRMLNHTVEISDINSGFTSVQGINVMFKNKTLVHAVADKRKGGLPAGL